jgi:hypothetical protein
VNPLGASPARQPDSNDNRLFLDAIAKRYRIKQKTVADIGEDL